VKERVYSSLCIPHVMRVIKNGKPSIQTFIKSMQTGDEINATNFIAML
jgi:hypothetical protein